MNIYQKLHEIQKSITALKKNAKGHGYEYLNGDKLLEHIKPKMNELGLILKQEVLSIENDRMDYKTGVGTNYEKPKSEILSKVMMRFTWIDIETGDKDENLFGANGQNDWDKGVGSALTYGERYFLLKYFHIATDEDDVDNPLRKKEDKEPANTQQPASPQPPAPKQPEAKKPEPPANDRSKEFNFEGQLQGKYDELMIKANKLGVFKPDVAKKMTANASWDESKYRTAYNWVLERIEQAEAAAKAAEEEKKQAIANVRATS